MNYPTEPHPLLDAGTPNYTHATIRRAFIVWLRCGQKNNFKDVCNYYHRLEAMEEQLPAETRASSRHQEMSLFTQKPPTSSYLKENFPQLYASPPLENQLLSQNYAQSHYQRIIDPSTNIIKVEDMNKGFSSKDIFDASQVFKAPVQTDFINAAKVDTDVKMSADVKYNKIGPNNTENVKYNLQGPSNNAFAEALKRNKVDEATNSVANDENKSNGITKRDIVETSQMIRNYCQDKQIPLKTFLENFKEYGSRCDLTNTVTNVGFYIKRKMVHEEIKMAVNIHRLKRHKESVKNQVQKIGGLIIKPTEVQENISKDEVATSEVKNMLEAKKENMKDITNIQTEEIINKQINDISEEKPEKIHKKLYTDVAKSVSKENGGEGLNKVKTNGIKVKNSDKENDESFKIEDCELNKSTEYPNVDLINFNV